MRNKIEGVTAPSRINKDIGETFINSEDKVMKKTFDFNEELLDFDSVVEKTKRQNKAIFAEIIEIEPVLF